MQQWLSLFEISKDVLALWTDQNSNRLRCLWLAYKVTSFENLFLLRHRSGARAKMCFIEWNYPTQKQFKQRYLVIFCKNNPVKISRSESEKYYELAISLAVSN